MSESSIFPESGLSAQHAWELTQFLCRSENRLAMFSVARTAGWEPSQQLGLVVEAAMEFVQDWENDEYSYCSNKNILAHIDEDQGAFNRFRHGKGPLDIKAAVALTLKVLNYLYLGVQEKHAMKAAREAFEFTKNFFTRTGTGHNQPGVPSFLKIPRNVHGAPFSHGELSSAIRWLTNQRKWLNLPSELLIVSGGRGFTQESDDEYDHFMHRSELVTLIQSGGRVILLAPKGRNDSEFLKGVKDLESRVLKGSQVVEKGGGFELIRIEKNNEGFCNPAFVYVRMKTTFQGKETSSVMCVRARSEGPDDLEEPLTVAFTKVETEHFNEWVQEVLVS